MSDAGTAQWERAHQAWELVVLDAGEPETVRAIRKVLRLKRFEVADLVARLPGVVRRGAQVDLEPLEAGLTQAGVRCVLRRSAG